MEVEKFLKLKEEEILKYDFTHDCDFTRGDIYKKLEGYEKYFAYKTLDNVKDPDSSSELLQKIYRILWPSLNSMEYIKVGKWICSDTMTSIQHTLARYYKDMFPDEIRKYMDKNRRQRFVSVRMCAALFSECETVKQNLTSNNDLCHFISVYHTLGNYSPVPIGFNVARSGVGYSSDFDYWDLTMMKIKKYFDLRKEPESKIGKDVYQIVSLLHCEEIISNCLQWLDGYDSWKEFVEENFFQDYVDENWEVIPFCKGHSWEDGSNEISDYDEFFKNAWTRIESRTNRIIWALKDKLDKS